MCEDVFELTRSIILNGIYIYIYNGIYIYIDGQILSTVDNEIGRELVPSGKVFRDTRVRSSVRCLDGSYAEYGAPSAEIHDRDSRVGRDRMTV